MTDDEFRLSGWLRTALIADLVVDDLTPEGDRLLEQRPTSKGEARDALERQLNLSGYGRDIDATMDYLLIELEALLKASWPPRVDLEWCVAAATRATKNMRPIEIYSMLLAGPHGWRRGKLRSDTTVDGLPKALKLILENALGAELHHMLERWIEWDIPKLAENRKAAVMASEKLKPALTAKGTPRRRPSLDQLRDNRTPPYMPPGRT